LGRKELAIAIIEGEIRSAQQEAFIEAAKLVLTGDPIEIARQLHETCRADDPAERTNRLTRARRQPLPSR
jgi:hypothetical protein